MIYDSKKFNIRYKAFFDFLKLNNEIRIWIAKPMDNSYQKINKFLVSPKPKFSYKDDQGNEILYFEFKNLKKIDIQMNIIAILSKIKIDLNKKHDLSFDKSLSRYIKSERFLEHTSAIKKLTLEITKNDKNNLEKINTIFNFIAKKFKYCYPVKNRGVKNLDLKRLKGDCGEYSGLFVTMCRILKIPTRNTTGFTIFPKQKNINEHGWASVYLKKHGWIDVDPQYASLEKNINIGAKKYFLRRSEYRIAFINGFNISLKPSIPKGFLLDYWNKIGLPLENDSVQTLQPLIFSSKNKIRFKENIEIIK